MKVPEHGSEIAIEFSDGDPANVDFDAHNAPIDTREVAGDYSSSSRGSQNGELSDSLEEDFTRRCEELNRALSEPFLPLAQRGCTMYGETTTFSENNIVWFGGRIVFGPQYGQMMTSIVLATCPVVLLTIVFVHALPPWLHALTWLSWLTTIVLLIWTSCIDPGIVPKRMSTLEPCPPRVRLFINDKEAGLRYCQTCDVYRGPRTHHCGICGNCVDQYDHHCPWTGTCIGYRNYHLFLYFLHSLHVLAAAVVIDALVATINHSIEDEISILRSLGDLYYIPVVLIGFVFLAGVSITGLMLFHWFLILRNVTTAEYLKVIFENQSLNPWDLGWWGNVKAKFSGWFDERTLSSNYECFVVKEIVRREIALLSQEREEEVRQHAQRNANKHVHGRTIEHVEGPTRSDPPTFVEAETGLYI